MIYFGTWMCQERNQTYLEENLSKDTVCLLPEDRREYDGDPVVSGLYIDSLLITIMDGHEVSLSCRRAFELLLLLESQLKRRRQRISLQERNRMDKSVPLFFIVISRFEQFKPWNRHLPPSGGAVSRSMRRLIL
jgi:hypothetical protein